MKKIFKLLFATLLTLSLLVACGGTGNGETDGDNGDGTGDSGTEIILITDVGTIDDKSFNQGSYEGVKQYGDEHGISYDYYRPTAADDEAYYDEISKAITDGGAKIIVTPGYLFEPAVMRAQYDFPDTKFVILDGAPEEIADNTYSILYREEQAGFLAGYAAVKEGMTELAYIGGMKVPAVEAFGIGYVYGAELAAEEEGVKVNMRYHYANTFEPSDAVNALASSWYVDGTEVIFVAAGGSGPSVFAAANQHEGAKVIGVDVDQRAESDKIITSAMKYLQLSVYEALDAFYKDNFPGGTQFVYGAEDEGIGLPDNFDRFENFTKADYDEIFDKLKKDTDSVRTNIPRTHEVDFSDHTFKNVTVTVVGD